jgi:hypothetical protein
MRNGSLGLRSRWVSFYPPQNFCNAASTSHSCAPKGYYMVFHVSSLGVPYGAEFIRLQ